MANREVYATLNYELTALSVHKHELHYNHGVHLRSSNYNNFQDVIQCLHIALISAACGDLCKSTVSYNCN